MTRFVSPLLGLSIFAIASGYLMTLIPLMVYFALMMELVVVFFMVRILFRPAIYTGEEQAFVPVPRTSPVVAQIDPRGETEDDQEPAPH